MALNRLEDIWDKIGIMHEQRNERIKVRTAHQLINMLNPTWKWNLTFLRPVLFVDVGLFHMNMFFYYTGGDVTFVEPDGRDGPRGERTREQVDEERGEVRSGTSASVQRAGFASASGNIYVATTRWQCGPFSRLFDYAA